jgi:hypothetical protein
MTKRLVAGLLSLTMVFSGTAAMGISADTQSADGKILINMGGGGLVGEYESGNFEYNVKSDGTAELVYYKGGDTDLTIPSAIDGKKVTSIANFTFSDDSTTSTLKSVVIPDTVTSIGIEAFLNCYNLTSITVPSSVTSIDEHAIGYKFSLETFEDVRDADVTVYCVKDSAAYDYAKSNGLTVKLITEKPSAPTVSAKFTSTTSVVRINWKKSENADGYIICRYNTSTKKWSTVKKITNAKTLTYRDTKLKSGTVYKYKVKAYKGSAVSDASKTITAATKPAKVTVTKKVSAKTAVRLYWKKTNCSGYKIQRYNAKTKKWVTVKKVSSSATNCRISGLKKNTTYKFRIQAYKTVTSKTTVYSAVSKTVTVKTKK